MSPRMSRPSATAMMSAEAAKFVIWAAISAWTRRLPRFGRRRRRLSPRDVATAIPINPTGNALWPRLRISARTKAVIGWSPMMPMTAR